MEQPEGNGSGFVWDKGGHTMGWNEGRGRQWLCSSAPFAVPPPVDNHALCFAAADGHIVTNYHVLASVLSGAAGKVQPGGLVARVLLLNGEGVQQAFDGFLVGASLFRSFLSSAASILTRRQPCALPLVTICRLQLPRLPLLPCAAPPHPGPAAALPLHADWGSLPQQPVQAPTRLGTWLC